MVKYFKENFHFLFLILILTCSLFVFEPTIAPDTKFFLEAGKNLFKSLIDGNLQELFFLLLDIEILFKLISIININIFFQIFEDNAKYYLTILNLIIFFHIYKINCKISNRINSSNNNWLFLILLFLSFLYLPVFLWSFKILTDVYFQLFCLMYFQQLFREDLKIKNLFIISILSLFINPMGLILVGFTLIIIISNWLKINVYLLILLSIIAIIFFIPLVLTFLLDALNYNNIIDYKNLGRLRFLEKGNIIYSFLYYDQGAFKWCNDYCNFGEIYITLKSNTSYYDYLISGLLRIYYIIFPVRPYFSFNHNILISISMIIVYVGFIFNFKILKTKNFLPISFILFFITFFVITPLSPSYRYQSAFYLMLIPFASSFYNFVLVRIYEKYFN